MAHMEARPGSERAEWRAIALPLLVVLPLFGWAALLTARPGDGIFAVPYAVGLAWLVRALAGWARSSGAPLTADALAAFRDRQFWSRPARGSYALVVVCDGLFLASHGSAPHFVVLLFCALACAFAPEVGLIAAALALAHAA
jgi:hypothetical protein